jgi:8-oxo-dGTP pyrophosphatase MutT (NUDIX family)
LLKHRKLPIWVEPGGHVDENERPDDAAVREVLEETGISVRLICAAAHDFSSDLELLVVHPVGIRLRTVETNHEHIEFVYAAVPIEGSFENGERTSGEVRWFSIDEIKSQRCDIPQNVRQWSLLCAKHIISKTRENTIEGILYDGK